MSLPKAARDELNIPEDAGMIGLPSRGAGASPSEMPESAYEGNIPSQASQPNLGAATGNKEDSVADEEDRTSSMKEMEDEKDDQEWRIMQ